MMVVSAGSAGTIADLKALLEVVGDPKKALKALTDLKQETDKMQELFEEKEKLAAQASADCAKAQKFQAEAKEALEKAEALKQELSDRQSAINSSQHDLGLKAEEVKLGQAQLVAAKAAFEKEKDACAKHSAKLAVKAEKELAEAQAMKADYEAKLLKLKQAVG